MMTLPFSHPHNFLNLQTKHPFLGLKRSCKNLPNLLISSNSQKHEQPVSLFPPLNQSVAAIIFGDGSESRLYPLTKRRSEGAIPIAANYRLIDAVVSNCINSNINKIYALTQFNSTSLNSHLSRAYSGVGLWKDGFVEVIAAYQSPEDQDWFQGTADAVRRCLWVLEEYPVTEFLVLPGHHLYRMDYQRLVEAHRCSKADITIAALGAMRDQIPGSGFLKVNSENQVLEFGEKIEWNPSTFSSVESSKNIDYSVFSSMGIYVIDREMMIKLLTEIFPTENDFTSEVVPGAVAIGMKVGAYIFDGYWEDMRSIEAFYHANMESTKRTNVGYKSVTLVVAGKAEVYSLPQLTPTCSFYSSMYDRDFPIYTLPRHLPPTHITDAIVTDSVIGDGCILNRCKIKGTVVGMRTRVEEGAIIEDSVIMGSDTYQAQHTEDAERNDSNQMDISIPIGIGKNTQIRKAIVDKNARIGKNVMIFNKDKVEEGNREENGYVISGGIVVVLRSAVIRDGTVI